MIWIKTAHSLQKFDSVRVETDRFKVWMFVAMIIDSNGNRLTTKAFTEDHIADVMNYITEKVVAPVPTSIIDFEELNELIEGF